ncbi:hypothetical protein ECO10021_22852, partial [Escherichia coli O26:H11 str. CVM10021]
AVEPTAIELKADILCWRLDALLFDRCQLIKDVVLYWTVGERGEEFLFWSHYLVNVAAGGAGERNNPAIR